MINGTNLDASAYSYDAANERLNQTRGAIGATNKAACTYDKIGQILTDQASESAGKEADANSGLEYYLYRFYDPTFQRWPNRDPLGELGFDQLCQIKAPISGEGPNLCEFVRNNSITKYDIVGLALTSCDCANFLKGALQGLSNLLAEDYKQGVYEGILFTTGGLLLSEVGGVILGGAGDIYDMYNTGQLIGEANEQMASAIKTYNACMTSVVNHTADPNSR
jgi:RHS repeat-associated protein